MKTNGKAVRSKQFKYKITETDVPGNGITYKDPERIVTVEVNDDGKGHLTANVLESDASKLNFTNDYNATGSIQLSVTKEVTPYWPDGLEGVTFSIASIIAGLCASAFPNDNPTMLFNIIPIANLQTYFIIFAMFGFIIGVIWLLFKNKMVKLSSGAL